MKSCVVNAAEIITCIRARKADWQPNDPRDLAALSSWRSQSNNKTEAIHHLLLRGKPVLQAALDYYAPNPSRGGLIFVRDPQLDARASLGMVLAFRQYDPATYTNSVGLWLRVFRSIGAELGGLPNPVRVPENRVYEIARSRERYVSSAPAEPNVGRRYVLPRDQCKYMIAFVLIALVLLWRLE